MFGSLRMIKMTTTIKKFKVFNEGLSTSIIEQMWRTAVLDCDAMGKQNHLQYLQETKHVLTSSLFHHLRITFACSH